MLILALYPFLTDIAKVSVEQCEERYKELQKTHESRRYRDPLFQPEFITADCSKVTEISQILTSILCTCLESLLMIHKEFCGCFFYMVSLALNIIASLSGWDANPLLVRAIFFI